MYKAYYNGILFYDPRIDELALLNPVVELEENKAGSFSFTIMPENPAYDHIKMRKTVIEVYNDDQLVFAGIPIERTEDFYKKREIYCEGELTYLNDSIQRQAKYQNMTVRGLLETYIDYHNAQVEETKQFRVGIVTVKDNNDSLYRFTNMQSTMMELKEDLIDDLGGFFRIRHEDGEKYIDYLEDSQNTNRQIIKLGKNLIDYSSNIDSSEIATAVIPLGKKLEVAAVEGLETRLDIKSVNNGLDYVCSNEAVNEFGWIYKVVEWDDVTEAANLKKKGEKYLSDTQFENMIIEAKAVDLGWTSQEIEHFKLSDKIRVVSKPHGLDRYFRLTKQTLHLDMPEKDTITLGKNEKRTLSARNTQTSYAIKKAMESITPTSDIIKQAAQNATELITNAMGGYVYKTNNELYIMDTNNPETATKVWRWNINGLGYSSTGVKGPYGLAMTMDGSIVADYITAGTMYADRIKGGTLTLGGSSNANGLLKIVDASGNVIGSWGVDGINAKKGTFEGTIKSNSAEITGGSIDITTSVDGKKIIRLISQYHESYMNQQGLYCKETSNGVELKSNITSRSAYFNVQDKESYYTAEGILIQYLGNIILNITKDHFVSKNDIRILDDWYDGWTITECLKDLYNRVSALEG